MARARLVLVAALVALIAGGIVETAAAQSRVPVSPNSKKYSDAGVKPATGRSGSAVVQTRAMIAKNATMLVEASTGDIEAGPGLGHIAKAQLKIGDRTMNYNDLTGGGYWSAMLPAVARGTHVQVQTNVRGIDPKRTDVVTTEASALFRPDITVRSVSGPGEWRPKIPVNFYATVAELNEDMGARTNCVLSIDDVVVDVADRIWVDAGDVVTCEFSYAFEKPGKYAVKVAATDVTPGDWDDVNNSAATSITIVSPDRKITSGFMYAFMQREFRDYESGRSGCVVNGYSCDYVNRSGYSDIRSNLQAVGSTSGASAPLGRLDVEGYANGMIQHKVSLAPTRSDIFVGDDYRSHCQSYGHEFPLEDGSWVFSRDRFRMCTIIFTSYPQWGYTNYEYLGMEGKVSYYSSYHSCNGLGTCGGWSSNSPTYLFGGGQDLGWTAGTILRLKLTYADKAGIFHTLDRSVTLQGGLPSESIDSTSEADQWGGIFFQQMRLKTASASAFVWFNDPQ